MTRSAFGKKVLRTISRSVRIFINSVTTTGRFSCTTWLSKKRLKARILGHGKEIPVTHNLLKLAKEAGLGIDKRRSDKLNEITAFNLEARYDSYKLSFYKKATREFAKKWSGICQELLLWTKK